MCENTEDLLYEMVCTIKEIIDENRYLRKENKELQEKYDEQCQETKSAYEGSQKITESWMTALLNGDITLKDKQYETLYIYRTKQEVGRDTANREC